MHKAFLSLGSNLGIKIDNLDKAVDIIKNHKDIHTVIVSSYYATDPWGYEKQDEFVNIAMKVETTLTPYALLELCFYVEETLKRVREVRWGPRTIDVDVILYDELELTDEALTIPHPRMEERGFVLIPIKEIEPGLMIQGVSIVTLINQLPPGGVRKI